MKSFSFLLFLLFASVSYGQNKITLLFAGDLMQHQAQIDAACTDSAYDYSDCFRYVREEISGADIAIGNLEVTLGGKPYQGYPTFSAPDEYLQAIKEAGFDVLITANNHCLDRKKKGLERTVQMLDSLKILRAGTYLDKSDREKHYPLLIEKNGFRIALLNYTYGTNGIEVTSPNIVNYINREIMRQDIQRALKSRPDMIIACLHWGIEYEQQPDKEQKNLADWLISEGVDHVIGSHPHVLQPAEMYKSTDSLLKEHVVLYSLGNYISNMSVRHTDGGIMFKMDFTKLNRIVRLTDCGYSLVWTSRPAISGNKNFVLYPAARMGLPLNIEEANQLKIFVNDSRKLFEKYNHGIFEYVF